MCNTKLPRSGIWQPDIQPLTAVVKPPRLGGGKKEKNHVGLPCGWFVSNLIFLFMKISKNIWSLGLTLCAAAVLTACGGGGGSSASSTSTYDIAGASASAATAMGVSAITPDASDTAALAGADAAIDLAATVGDTWRLVYISSTKVFKLRAVSSSYGLSGYSGQGTLTKTVNGSIETYTGNFGTPGTLNGGTVTVKLDTRTKSMLGSVTWHNGTTDLVSDVTGTQLALGTSLSGLAGDYVFANQARNQSDGGSPDSTAGTLNVGSNGLVKICPRAKYISSATATNSGKCVNLDGSNPVDPITLQMTAHAGGNLTLAPTGGNTITLPAGVINIQAHVQAGDLGPVLVVDQDWLNNSSIRRTGIFVAARISTIDASKFAGTFYCPAANINNVKGVTVTATSTSFSGTNSGGTATGTVAINKVYDAGQLRDFPGAFSLSDGTTQQVGFQLSSSLFVFQNGGGTRLNFCQRT